MGRKEEENLFDYIKDFSNILLEAFSRGGMPLVFIISGFILCLVASFFKFLKNDLIFWILLGVGVLFILASIVDYFIEKYSKKNKSEDNLCPECGGFLVKRVAKRGEFKGKKFIGCSNFPKCKYKIY